MTPDTSFNYGLVSPVECLKAGWAAINDRSWLFVGITLVATLLGGAVPIVLIGPMMSGLYICLLASLRAQPIEFGLLLKVFDHFLPGLAAAATQTVPIPVPAI